MMKAKVMRLGFRHLLQLYSKKSLII